MGEGQLTRKPIRSMPCALSFSPLAAAAASEVAFEVNVRTSSTRSSKPALTEAASLSLLVAVSPRMLLRKLWVWSVRYMRRSWFGLVR